MSITFPNNEFSQERFVDIGQTLYVEWLKTFNGLDTVGEKERREAFSKVAKFAFEATEEFAEVFRFQENI